jgi:hypothetical protein
MVLRQRSVFPSSNSILPPEYPRAEIADTSFALSSSVTARPAKGEAPPRTQCTEREQWIETHSFLLVYTNTCTNVPGADRDEVAMF